MTIGTLLARPSVFAVTDGFGFQAQVFKRDGGVLSHKAIAVFRSGTFRDSSGEQSTWDIMHIEQMVRHYEHLKNKNIFRDVPVRNNHPNWLMGVMPGVGQTVGWHTNVWTEKRISPVDGKEYDYLLVDYDITDPRAAEMIENGTWRNRSAEIFNFRTNDEAEYWPTYGGFAWVDIPAVEGLNFNGQTAGAGSPRYFDLTNLNKEPGVQTDTTQPGSQTAPAANPPAPTASPAQPSLLGVVPAPVAFSIGGQSVTDPVVVQAHITSLEAFQNETLQNNRAAFVAGLASNGVILASQVESLTAFAATLNPEQFAAWSSSYADAPRNSVLAGHNAANTNGTPESNNAGGTESPQDVQHAIDLETVKQHRRVGATPDQIKNTASYRRLEAAGKAPTL